MRRLLLLRSNLPLHANLLVCGGGGSRQTVYTQSLDNGGTKITRPFSVKIWKTNSFAPEAAVRMRMMPQATVRTVDPSNRESVTQRVQVLKYFEYLVKIMVLFGVLSIIRHLVFRRPKNHNVDKHPYEYAESSLNWYLDPYGSVLVSASTPMSRGFGRDP